MDEQTLQELATFESTQSPVLSVYLNVDPHRRSRDKYKLALRRLLESVSDQADPRDIARIEQYIDLEYDWQGKAVACFSCQKPPFWRAFPLLLPLEDLVFVGERPYVKPLTELMGRYAVVLVHREGARWFVYQMGTLQEQAEFVGEDVKRHRQGGWSAKRYQSHEDEAAQRNLREAADRTARFCRQHHCDYLIIAGTEINAAQFQALLPKHLQDKVIGHLTVDSDASPSEIGNQSAALMEKALAQQKAMLVERLRTVAAKGGSAAAGLSDTLGAASDGRWQHLVVEQGFHAEGYECTSCGFMTTEPLDRCRFCEGTMAHVPDAVNNLVRRAIQQELDITVVPPDENTKAIGHIGAFLRY